MKDNKAVEIIYKDLCEYYDYLRKQKYEKWMILGVINKNRQLIIDDIKGDNPTLDINNHNFKKAFKKLEREYDNETDDNLVHAFGWKRVAFTKALDAINSGDSSYDEEEDDDLEREMDAYNLDDEEKELVRKGEYDPWDFEYPSDHEDEDMDDDDYYEEDDI